MQCYEVGCHWGVGAGQEERRKSKVREYTRKVSLGSCVWRNMGEYAEVNDAVGLIQKGSVSPVVWCSLPTWQTGLDGYSA